MFGTRIKYVTAKTENTLLAKEAVSVVYAMGKESMKEKNVIFVLEAVSAGSVLEAVYVLTAMERGEKSNRNGTLIMADEI